MQTERGRIVRQGMGGFLNPPGHPEHEYSVETDLNRGGMSLSEATEAEWLNVGTKIAAKRLLQRWELTKKPLTDPEVQEWILQVLGYFRGCYKGQTKDGQLSWDAIDLRILPDTDPVLNADLHAGVNLIRKYYPEFQPTAEQFAGSYWGSKPVAA